MPRLRLTKRSIDALPPATRKRGESYFDTELRGFGLTCYPSGRKVFFVNYGPSQRRRRMSLGPYGVRTVGAARTEAQMILAQVLDGHDPQQERQDARAIPTVDEWIRTYMEDVKRRKKSWRDDKRHLGWTSTRWKGRRLDSLTTEELRRAFAAYGEQYTPIQANRWLASFRACLAAAWRSDLVPSNPAAKVRPNPEPDPRTRVLSDDELARLWQAIQLLEDPHARMGLVLLVVTGARRSEVLRARWEDFDLDDGVWRIPATKTGRPQLIPLTPATVEALRDVPRKGLYVVAGRKPDKPRRDLKRPWDTVREKAKLQDVRMHDLRRTYGLSVARTAGLHVASKLLRHSDVRVTERHYAPLGFDLLRGAQAKVEKKRSNVLAFRRGGE